MSNAGETFTIRLPKGVREKLQAATGMKVGPLLRDIALAYLKRLEAEQAKAGTDMAEKVSADVADIVKEQSSGQQ